MLFKLKCLLRIFLFASSIVQVVANCQNTVQGFKRFHGRAFPDPYVQSTKSNLVYNLAQMPSGATGIKVQIYFFMANLPGNKGIIVKKSKSQFPQRVY